MAGRRDGIRAGLKRQLAQAEWAGPGPLPSRACGTAAGGLSGVGVLSGFWGTGDGGLGAELGRADEGADEAGGRWPLRSLRNADLRLCSRFLGCTG